MDDQPIRTRMSSLMPQVRADLERLVRIPSIGFPGYDPANVRASAEATADVLSSSGLRDTRLIEIPDGHPAVFGEIPGPVGAPTVLLYAHHDVQPEGPLDEWESPPFEPAEREGRLFGRGTSDDKCGIAMHSATLRAFDGAPPVGVKVIVEGEEECSSEHLDFLVGEHVDMLRADAVVIADSGVWRRGIPALTTSIRGVVAATVEVRVARKALHSGIYGGPVPDAITALSRMIASLHDDRGNVTVPGLARDDAPGFELSEEDFATDAGLVPGLRLLGEGTIPARLWRGPSINVIGIDAPRIREASFQIVPVARAAVTMRIAPGEDPQRCVERLEEALISAAPWGVSVQILDRDSRGRGYDTQTSGPFYEAARGSMRDAWGVDPVDMGMGGSVPLVPLLADTFPDATILLTGCADEQAAAHSTNESVDLAELERACLAEALFLAHLSA